jgi:cobalt-zinc-cadmium efflux system membrane fusion protein
MIPRTPLLLLLVATGSVQAGSEILSVSESEQDLIGIEVQAVSSVAARSAGELSLMVGFSPDGEWVIKTPLPGLLQRAWIQVGDKVAEGDPLMTIRSSELVALERDFLKAGAELTLQRSAWERDKKLNQAGSISTRRWQETLYAYNTAKAEYSGLRAQLMMAGFSEEDVKRLSREMEVTPDMTLRAPADALVLERPAMLGDHLEGSELLARLGEPDKLILEGMLSKSAAAHLSAGMDIVMEDSEQSAVIVLVSDVIDPASQTVRIRAEPNDSSGLTPGQLTRWRVLAGDDLLTVPSAAIVKLEGRDVAYVKVTGGFEARQVSVRGTAGGDWIVLSGLGSRDQVVISGTAALKGMSLGMGGGDG